MQGAATAHTDVLPGRTLNLAGKEYLYFSGTSYLGMPFNQTFKECLLAGLERYGTNFSGSRNANLKLQVFEEVESKLADLTGAEAALTMSSGYLAGQLVVQYLKGQGEFMYAPGTHPAIWRKTKDGRSGKFEEWVPELMQSISRSEAEHFIILCNSLDPLHATEFDFDWLKQLPAHKKYTVVVDDSHGLGVRGSNGGGCYHSLKKLAGHARLIVVSSLGKAFGVPAGVVLGDADILTQLRKSNCFGGASPANPAFLYAFIHCDDTYGKAREKLMQNITLFKSKLNGIRDFRSIENYPVFYTRHNELSEHLLKEQIMISSFRYPTPADEAITRVVINSLHTPNDLEKLAVGIHSFYKFSIKA